VPSARAHTPKTSAKIGKEVGGEGVLNDKKMRFND
jgi:hypothetical protein